MSEKIAFVTGGASGTGAALATNLVDEGAEVWIADHVTLRGRHPPSTNEVALPAPRTHHSKWRSQLELHCGCIKHRSPNRISIKSRKLTIARLILQP